MRARYYNTTTGRFLTRDTYLGSYTDPLSLNRYTYAHNNPIKYNDPTGHAAASAQERSDMVQSAYNAYLGGYISGAEYAAYASKTLGIVISDPSAKSNSSSAAKNGSSAGSSSSNISSNKSSSTTKPKDTQQIVPLALNTQPSNYVYEIKKPSTVGDISNDVEYLQYMLYDLGYFKDLEMESSRWFEGSTAAALIRFQVVCMGRSFDSLFDVNSTYIGCDDQTRLRLNEIYKLSDKNRAYYRWDKVNRYRSNYNPAELISFVSDLAGDRVYKNLVKKNQLEQWNFFLGKTEKIQNQTVSEINRILYQYDITTPIRIAFFFGQIAGETSNSQGVRGALPLERFDTSPPETFFNKKYNGRLGNIPGTNDGELFRGSGFLHLTGRYNYERFANYIADQSIITEGYRIVGGIYNKPFSEMVAGEIGHIDVGQYAWESAGWFWKYGTFSNGQVQNLNFLADSMNVAAITRSITGGTDGVAKRTAYTKEIYNILTGKELGI